jgi:MEMO1 family protein
MVRQPAVAGAFYPADATILRQTVKQLLTPSVGSFETQPPLKALIVPNAGYIYSGPVAGHGYAQLVAHVETVRRLILLGPTHRAPVRGIALPEANAFATPLGEVQIDQESIRRLADISQVVVYDAAHASEHSLEVQLPLPAERSARLHFGPARRR